MKEYENEAADVGEIIEAWTKDPVSRQHITHVEVIPEKEAVWSEYPSELNPALLSALEARNLHRPYVHQADAFKHILGGRNVVVVTPTASGKTLCYNVPVIDEIVSGRAGNALYLFPTKALAQDQLAELNEWSTALEKNLSVFTYDGDTPQGARSSIRKSARIIITNPDMLHMGVLPHHTRWATFLSRLKYIVIDEMHIYRGIFGSHFANLLRRLKRICKFYGVSPQFVCCSATIRNPRELAGKLIEEAIVLVDTDGAPASEKYIVFYNPPIVNPELGIRANYLRVARTVASYFLQRGVQSIIFATSRMNVEILVKYLREDFAGLEDSPDFIAGYRGGYLPSVRREIEKGLRDGKIRCVVATNALELGIDIGQLDSCILAGYPGSIASMWQQAGRAGRRSGRSAAVLVARNNPLDQFIVNFPEYFLGRSPEYGLINPDNLHLLIEHIKCAAFELPFKSDEEFGGENLIEILRFLAEKGVLHEASEVYHYSNSNYPAEDISLRSVTQENFLVINRGEGDKVIAEVDSEAVHRTVYKNAIYMAEGKRYIVEELDWDKRRAYVQPSEVDYFTIALGFSEVAVRAAYDVQMYGPSAVEHGEVEITGKTTGFKKVRFYTGENLGEGEVDLPERRMSTTAYWFTVPDEMMKLTGLNRAETLDGMLGAAYVIHQIAAFTLMCDTGDLGYSVGDRSAEWFVRKGPEGGAVYGPSVEDRSGSQRLNLEDIDVFEPSVYFYDNYPGGVGFSPVLFSEHTNLLTKAVALVERCSCPDGCPSCVGPAAEVGPRGKDATLTLMQGLINA